MSKGNISKISEQNNGQFRLTIPKALALAIGLKKGDSIEFTINKKGNLELIKLMEVVK
jgi:bifunctional DNA-binding transcriptional regulator/antitoxin component of YhaV-PrlF toxin-antitoxin module